MDQTVRATLRRFAATGDPQDAIRAYQELIRTNGAGAPVLIPTVGSRITLTQDWTFTLIGEYRNQKFYVQMHGEQPRGFWKHDGPARYQHTQPYVEATTTLPAGSVLRVDRIYVKKGIGEFDSVTFICEAMPKSEPTQREPWTKSKTKIVGRFWAPLNQVNEIVGVWDAATLPKARAV
jgi:hypothetical protein